jgi:hypothetical protein
MPFPAAVAGPPAGVYRAEIQLDGRDTYITCAVVSRNLQLGVIETPDGGLPAPSLNLDTGNFTLNGVAHHAQLLPADAPPPS